MEHHLYATLLALASLTGGFAHAIARTASGSVYVLHVSPYGAVVEATSTTIGSRAFNARDAYIQRDRMHLVGENAYDSLVTSPVVEVEVRSGSRFARPVTTHDHEQAARSIR